MSKRLVKAGDIFNSLIIQQELSLSPNNQRRFKCKCKCGTITEVLLCSLVTGHTKSCGCRKREHAGTIAKLRRKPPGEVTFNSQYKTYLRGAKDRGFSFLLTQDQFRFIVSQNCFYCGEAPHKRNVYTRIDGTRHNSSIVDPERASIRANGIDRKNSDLGYSLDNCVSCCPRCNITKLDIPHDEYIQHAYKIVSYQESLKASSWKI